jgi:hypothetical protein
MTRRKGIRPEQYAGVFQRYDEVPERYRLQTYAQQYAGANTWDEYVEDVLFEEHDPVSDYLRDTARRAGESWLAHMDDCGRHHALATPADVEAWCADLLDGRTAQTAHEKYYLRIYQFYEHLATSYHHPHAYNPLLLAAIEHDSAREVWMYRIDTRPEAVDRE